MLLSGVYYNDTTTPMVTFTIYSPVERKEFLENQIREITGGVLRLEEAGMENIRIDIEGNVLEDKNKEKKE